MRMLIVTTRLPYPPFQGDKLKIFNLARELSRKHEVTIVCLQRRGEDFGAKALRDLGVNLITVRHGIFTSVLNLVLAAFSSTPFQVAWYKSKKMVRTLRRILTNQDFDVTYFHLIRGAQYASQITKGVKCLDFTDAVSLYLERFSKVVTNPFLRLIIEVEHRRVKRYEKKAEDFDLSLVCSESDLNYLRKSGVKGNILLLRNGIDTEQFKSSNHEKEYGRIVFTGNMSYYPNIDAAEYFVKKIFPEVLRAVPGSRFYIVGQRPAGKIRALASDRVVVTGFVDDIRSEYSKSVVAVAPTRFGAGSLNKVIEPILMGVPIVATPVASEGLPETLRKFVRVAQSENDFARQVIQLLESGIPLNGRDLQAAESVSSILSWKTIVGEFIQHLEQFVNSEAGNIHRTVAKAG